MSFGARKSFCPRNYWIRPIHESLCPRNANISRKPYGVFWCLTTFSIWALLWQFGEKRSHAINLVTKFEFPGPVFLEFITFTSVRVFFIIRLLPSTLEMLPDIVTTCRPALLVQFHLKRLSTITKTSKSITLLFLFFFFSPQFVKEYLAKKTFLEHAKVYAREISRS